MSEESIIITAVFVGFSTVVGGFIVLGIFLNKRRREALKDVAKEAGLTFSAKPSNQVIISLSNFTLARKGHFPKVQYLLEGHKDGTDWMIFDYSYMVSDHEHRNTTYTQTVIFARHPESALPKFFLCPENFFHKIGDALGFKDIDFETHPDFSKRYLLKGQDESKIRDLFKGSVLQIFEQEKKTFTMEAEGDRFIFYRPSITVSPQHIQEFFKTAQHISRLVFGK